MEKSWNLKMVIFRPGKDLEKNIRKSHGNVVIFIYSFTLSFK